jgi:dihydroflavonol-4-reductase
VQTYLITGANGFIGSHLVEKLLKDGCSVRCLVRKTSSLKGLASSGVDMAYGELLDMESLRRAVKDVDIVVHLAGKTRAASEDAFFRANVEGTRNLLQAVSEKTGGLRRFVYASSQAAAGPARHGVPVRETDAPGPVTPYGASKLEGEKVVLSFGSAFPVTIVRPPCVFGPRDRDMFTLFKSVRRGIRPLLGWRERLVSLVFVDDLVRGILLCAEREEASGQVFFINTADSVSWNEFGKTISRAAEKKSVPAVVPMSLFVAGSWVNDLACRLAGRETLFNRNKIREFLPRNWTSDSSKAGRMLGYKPAADIEKAVRLTMDWYVQQKWL